MPSPSVTERRHSPLLPRPKPVPPWLWQQFGRITGIDRLERLYRQLPAAAEGLAFIDAALSVLDVDWTLPADEAARIPHHGPIVIAANHPYGGIDGLATIAALLRDLKQRGLLADTLVAFVTEFGRMPTFQKGANGRDHNPKGFTVWLAGAGVKRGFSYGATDEFGYKAVENVTTIYDLHATMLHLIGLNHERLSFYNNGVERRLTDVHGHVVKDILA